MTNTSGTRHAPVFSSSLDLHTVDNGILKHLYPELERPESWDVLVAHFLGVDHCGHWLGKNHPEMAAKLTQLDNVIRNVTSLLPDDALLVVMSDHGMTTDGDHGGETEDELEAVLFLYAKKPFLHADGSAHRNSGSAQTDEVVQVDFVPTLALLLGLPIPYSSIGTLMPQVFPVSSRAGDLLPLWLNVQQVARYLGDVPSFPLNSAARLSELRQLWDACLDGRPGSADRFSEASMAFLKDARHVAREVWATYDLPLMWGGLALALGGALLLVRLGCGTLDLQAVRGAALPLSPVAVCAVCWLVAPFSNSFSRSRGLGDVASSSVASSGFGGASVVQFRTRLQGLLLAARGGAPGGAEDAGALLALPRGAPRQPLRGERPAAHPVGARRLRFGARRTGVSLHPRRGVQGPAASRGEPHGGPEQGLPPGGHLRPGGSLAGAAQARRGSEQDLGDASGAASQLDDGAVAVGAGAVPCQPPCHPRRPAACPRRRAVAAVCAGGRELRARPLPAGGICAGLRPPLGRAPAFGPLGPRAELAAAGPAGLLCHGPPDDLLDGAVEGGLCRSPLGGAPHGPGYAQGAGQHLCGPPALCHQPAPAGHLPFGPESDGAHCHLLLCSAPASGVQHDGLLLAAATPPHGVGGVCAPPRLPSGVGRALPSRSPRR
ncbi:hypothetical protein HPB47_011237, partial [Ixodes persulcatus]